jgi:parallel beta-helix repeat protein
MRRRIFMQTMLVTGVLVAGLYAPGFSENFIVTHTGDSGPGSLREAIQLSNNNSQPDSILFRIPVSDPGYQESTGVWSIRPVPGPWMVTNEQGLVIDGFSQTRFIGSDTNPFGPEIELSGQNCQGQDGLVAYFGALSVHGLTINRFKNGIYLENLTGGTISGCYVGTDPAGMRAEPNTSDGICLVHADYVQIFTHDSLNTIVSGNQRNGIYLADSSGDNYVSDCIIGLNRTCTETLKNRIGLEIGYGSDRNNISGNIISGNQDWGMDIYRSSGNWVYANLIGTNRTWQTGLGNGQMGILIWRESCANTVYMNQISGNQTGIVIGDNTSHENRLSRNVTWANTAKGIDNGYGGNRGIAPPALVAASLNWIAGKASPNDVVEIFCDEADEGRAYVGSDTTDGSGNFHLIPQGVFYLPNVTATARDSAGNTSEFSAPVQVTGIEEKGNSIPAAFSLSQNYPNPFNPETTIRFTVKEPGRVSLKVYDMLGNEAAVLVDRFCSAGNHSIRFDASGLPSGMYVVRMDAAGLTASRKMTVMK